MFTYCFNNEFISIFLFLYSVFYIFMNFPVRDNKVLLYCIVLYCIVLYCIVLYCIVLYCIVLYCIVLYCIVLYCIVLYCIVLYCIVLYCIVLYCIVLYIYICCPSRLMITGLGVRPCALIVDIYRYIICVISEIDVCESDPCQNGANCSQAEGSYICACPPGYTGLNCDIGKCNLFSVIFRNAGGMIIIITIITILKIFYSVRLKSWHPKTVTM